MPSTKKRTSPKRKTKTLSLRLDPETQTMLLNVGSACGQISQGAAVRLIVRTLTVGTDERILELVNRIRSEAALAGILHT